MSVVAFFLIACMLAIYVMLDGYDLGVAAITPLVARTDDERRACMRAIGPFWNGNEVWLIAAGGALFALFPKAYASAFSGFYLPLIVVLWLLMGRGIALELREHFPSALWHQFWDTVFALSSVLLIVIFGVALGNLVRGVPLDVDGYFTGTFAFLLNPYALLSGAFVLVALALHGATFLMVRVEGPIAARSRNLARALSMGAAALFVVTSLVTAAIRGVVAAPVYAVAFVSLAALVAVIYGTVAGKGGLAFVASCAWIASLMVVSAGTIFPYILPAFPSGTGGLSIYAAAPSSTALASALAVTLVGLVVVCIYSAVVWRKLAGKVRVGE
jgi:cytochrome bd ubiquinol oxidase subunit II